MKDIARESGYSIGTVSRAINHAPGVSKKAREDILKVVKKTGYQINENAKFLKQRNAHGILILIKGVKNMLFESLATRLQILLEKSEFDSYVHYIDESDNEVLEAIQLLTQRSLQGILFLGSDRAHFIDHFADIGIPCVLVTNSAIDLPFENLSSVSTDDAGASQFAIEYLFSLGHERIGVLGGYLDRSQTAKSRFQGVQYAFYLRNQKFDRDAQFASGDFSLKGGYDAMNELLDHMEKPTAIFVMSDVMAIGAIRAASDRGYTIGKDLSVIGFDGLELCDYLVPSLTTIVQDLDQIAARSFDNLKEMILHKKKASVEQISFTLRQGQSVAPVQS